MKQRIMLLIPLLIALLILSGCQKTESDFFAAVSFSAEEIDQITVTYQDITVPLSAENQQKVIQVLTQSKNEPLPEQDDYPFTPSPYQLSFTVNGEVLQYPIAWFNGKEYELIPTENDMFYYSSLFRYLDRRFDIQVNGEWISFCQPEDCFWNDDLNADAFTQVALEQGLIQNRTSNASSLVAIAAENDMQQWTWQDFLDGADLVVLATAQNIDASHHQTMHIVDILKGSETSPDVLVSLPPMSSSTFPSFQPEEPYLLCLKGDAGSYGLLTCLPSNYAAAVIRGETTYPPYNTEHHPFYQVSLEEIEDYLVNAKG